MKDFSALFGLGKLCVRMNVYKGRYVNIPMTQDTRFYSDLTYDTATDRLKQVHVRGVTITVNQPEPQVTEFRLDLHKPTPIGTFIMAQLKGTIQPTRDNQIQVAYQTYAYSRKMLWFVPTVGISISVVLLILLPSSMSPIISAPGVASILMVLFWITMGSEVRKDDRFRLEELLERMLEKRSAMMVWQA